MDIKENLAKNLIKYRKALNLTQAELAEKLNYSDKAVSKWERAESVPDLYVLKQIADFYRIKIDTLIAEPKDEKPQIARSISKKRATICLCCTGLVWLVAILCFTFPITLIILLVLTAVWHKFWTNSLIISLLIWSSLLSIFLTLSYLLNPVPPTLWMIFLIGVPAQAIVVSWYFYRKFR